MGKNILEQIGSRYEFLVPGHLELDLLDQMAVENFLSQNKFDVVIHAANVGGKRSEAGMKGVFEANKKMFLNLAEHADKFGKMVFFGSGAEYGKQRPIAKVKESDFGQVKPEDEYGQAKYFASEYIASAENITSLRLFGVFGKYEDCTSRFISNAICRAIFGLPIVMNQNVFFDYLYVHDLVRITDYFISHSSTEKFYNVGTGTPVDLLTVAGMVKKISGKNLEIQIKNPGLNKEYTCDNSLLLKEIPGLQFTSLELAIRDLYEWYEKNQGSINKELL